MAKMLFLSLKSEIFLKHINPNKQMNKQTSRVRFGTNLYKTQWVQIPVVKGQSDIVRLVTALYHVAVCVVVSHIAFWEIHGPYRSWGCGVLG